MNEKNMTASVYSQTGQLIKMYCDVTNICHYNTNTVFESNGKRIEVSNALLIIEEN